MSARLETDSQAALAAGFTLAAVLWGAARVLRQPAPAAEHAAARRLLARIDGEIRSLPDPKKGA